MRGSEISLVILLCVISLCVSAVCAPEAGEAYLSMGHGLYYSHDSSYSGLYSSTDDEDGKSVWVDDDVFMLYGDISLEDPLECKAVSGKIYTACCNVCSNTGAKTLQGSVVADVPEPTTMLLFATGLVGVIAFKKRNSLKKSDKLN